MRSGLKKMALSAGLAGLAGVAGAPRAEACGCFTPPDPTVPVVQAAEQILFSMEEGIVTAHIQVSYEGDAAEFGWLLPLPSVPTLELGVDEVFQQLIATTQPKYRLSREYTGNCPIDPNNPNFGGAAPGAAEGDSAGGDDRGEGSVLVVQDSIGPYDYAVLRADSQQPMLDWLADNHYFVPSATAEAVVPYIRPGAYFLALKLRGGEDVKDIQPVVVQYASDLPMIPIVLTSVGAAEDMPILVWMLGEGRAIPRNYYHTLVNDAAIDWLTAGSNYIDVVTRAVDESPTRRSFVTEYAGSSDLMRDVLDYPGRFGDLALLRTLTDPQEYLQYLLYSGYAFSSNQTFQLTFLTQVLGILEGHLPVPGAILDSGITPTDYYSNIHYWAQWLRDTNPKAAEAQLDLDFDPVALTAQLQERVVEPTLGAGALFKIHPRMTRLFTTLSPSEMTQDPVFSFNPDLPDVAKDHEARLIYRCGFGGYSDLAKVPATLITERGWTLDLPGGTAANPWSTLDMPASQFTQTLREEGQPELVIDNSQEIRVAIAGASDSAGGCTIAAAARASRGLAPLALLVASFVIAFRRRR